MSSPRKKKSSPRKKKTAATAAAPRISFKDDRGKEWFVEDVNITQRDLTDEGVPNTILRIVEFKKVDKYGNGNMKSWSYKIEMDDPEYVADPEAYCRVHDFR
ncbi:hypothetical protein TrCOL_g229 [Triparma columacea]|uniref:Uncharacterized protein n=1 Tax=Triparma columacea TaxID=722753 RepID=A0A9W7G1S2_9STRA|nr:hypothetical protein TrCOL_g229 [Triparma columacea]